jgi:protease-4
MGDTAASGGYWIAMNADKIIAEPGTLTGSIGIISGKFSGKELMQKLGINVDAVRTADNVGMWMPIAPFTPQQRDRVNALMDNSYRAFTQNVAAARKIPIEKMPDIAKGRVFTGAQAVKIGLVDELGGYTITFAAIRKKLKLADDDLITIEPYPRPETPVERIEKMLRSLGIGGVVEGSMLAAIHQLQSTLAPYIGDLSRHNMPAAARMDWLIQ